MTYGKQEGDPGFIGPIQRKPVPQEGDPGFIGPIRRKPVPQEGDPGFIGPIQPPTIEYTPQQLAAMSKVQTALSFVQWRQERRRYDPTKTYYEPMRFDTEGKAVQYRHVSGVDVLAGMDEWYRSYRRGQVDFQKELGGLDPRIKLKETEIGYETLPLPTRTTLITEKFEDKSWWEQKAVEVLSPIVQLPANIINLFGMGYTPKKWVHPDTGYHYLKEDLIIGYAPVTTYYDPITGERYSMKDKKFTKVDSPLLGFAEMTHKMPTFIDKPISYLPGASVEQKERASWVTERVSSDPLSILTMGVGEVATLWGFGQVLKPVGKVVSPFISKVVHSPIITKPIIRLTTGMQRGFGGISTKISPYLPSTIKTGYKGLFHTVTPGSFTTGRTTLSTWLDATTRYTSVVGSKHLQLQGGMVSRFIYYSPQRFGLSGIVTKPIIGASIITSRGGFKGISWAGKEPMTGWGLFKGHTMERLTTFKTYYPWSKGGNIYQSSQWFSKKAVSELQKVGTTTSAYDVLLSSKGFAIRGGKTTLGKPYGFPFFKKLDVTTNQFVMAYTNIDKFIPNLMKTLHPVDYSFYGMGNIIKPIVVRGGISTFEKPMVSSTWADRTTQLRGFTPQRMVSGSYINDLMYEPVSKLSPHQHFPKVYLHIGRGLGGTKDLLGGLVGAKLFPTVYGEGLFREPKTIKKHKRDVLRFQSDLDKLAYTPSVKGGVLTTGLLTDGLPSSKLAQKMLQGTAYQQAQAQAQVTKLQTTKTDFFSYTPTVKLPMIPLFPIPKSLYGRGRKGWFESGEFPGYRFRTHTIGTLSKDIDKMLSSFGMKTTKKKHGKKRKRVKRGKKR